MEFITYYMFVFVFGLLIGSFLNVCIYRLPLGESVSFPPSHCGSCGTTLKAYDLVPVFSYLFLRGHCRYCGAKVSIQYPAVELTTALIYTFLFSRFGLSFEFAASIFLASILLAVLVIDLKHLIIPDELVIWALVGGIAVVLYSVLFSVPVYGNTHWWEHLLGIVSGSGPLLLIAMIGSIILRNEDVMGMGDVKIFAPIGIILGWKLCLVDLFLSTVIAGVIGVVLILTGIKKRRDAIPFGPFIVIATCVTLLFGSDLLSWYLGLL